MGGPPRVVHQLFGLLPSLLARRSAARFERGDVAAQDRSISKRALIPEGDSHLSHRAQIGR